MRTALLILAASLAAGPASAAEYVAPIGFTVDDYANPTVLDISLDPVRWSPGGETGQPAAQAPATPPAFTLGNTPVSIAPPAAGQAAPHAGFAAE